MPGKPRLIPDPMDLRNLSGQYTHGETNRISRLKIPGSVPLDLGSVAHWSLMLCAAALGIIPGETYREPELQAASLTAGLG